MYIHVDRDRDPVDRDRDPVNRDRDSVDRDRDHVIVMDVTVILTQKGASTPRTNFQKCCKHTSFQLLKLYVSSHTRTDTHIWAFTAYTDITFAELHTRIPAYPTCRIPLFRFL